MIHCALGKVTQKKQVARVLLHGYPVVGAGSGHVLGLPRQPTYLIGSLLMFRVPGVAGQSEGRNGRWM